MRFTGKTPGGGLALPALIALLGLLAAFAAPTASAAATYDITQVGKVTIQSITDDKGRRLNGTHDGKEIAGGFTPDANQVTAKVRYGVHVDDMSRLAEGDRITVGQSGAGHFGVAAYSGGDTVRDQDGEAVFSIDWTQTRVTLTRLPGTWTGGLDLTFESNPCVAYRSYDSHDRLYSTSSTWTIGGDSYTFFNRPFTTRPATGGKEVSASAVIQRLANKTMMQSYLRWPGVINDMLNGADVTPDTGDVIIHDHITPMDGEISTVRFNSMLDRWPLAYDATHLSTANDFAMAFVDHGHPDDVRSLDDAKRLKPGQSSIVKNTDGSWDVAANLGSFTGPDALAGTAETWDKNTNDIIKWLHGHQCTSAWTSYRYDIVWSDPNRADTAMVETHLYRNGTTRSNTLTASNIAGGDGQAVTTGGVSYDPNGGEGTMDPTVGRTGATIDVAANAFTRAGHVFAGWSTKADGTGTAYRPGDALVLTKGVTVLYAQWTPITYAIRFDGNGATSGAMADLAATYDKRVTLPANRYAREGKAFTGWNTKPDGSGTAYRDKAGVSNLASGRNDVVVLYAQWADAMTVMPDTGGHATHMPPAAAGIVPAAALALAAVARRRARRIALRHGNIEIR